MTWNIRIRTGPGIKERINRGFQFQERRKPTEDEIPESQLLVLRIEFLRHLLQKVNVLGALNQVHHILQVVRENHMFRLRCEFFHLIFEFIFGIDELRADFVLGVKVLVHAQRLRSVQGPGIAGREGFKEIPD